MLIFGFRVQGFGFKVLGIRIILPTSMLSPHDGRDSHRGGTAASPELAPRAPVESASGALWSRVIG